MTSSPLHSRVRDLRQTRGWSQSRLGDQAGITRQSLAAIEAGRSVPSTEVALRLARVLGVSVDELFRLRDTTPDTVVVEASGLGTGIPGRVRMARVTGRRFAYGLGSAAGHGGTPADGHGEPLPDGRIRVRSLPWEPPEPDLVVAGCDPAFGLVADHLRREHDLEVLWLPAGSRAALEALERGVVHVAGVHLWDDATGTYNRPWVERTVSFTTSRISFAVWEQALLLERGNPLGIGGIEDLTRSEVRFLNREPGSGSRMLLELELARRGLRGRAIRGFFETAADGHETVAGSVAAGAANAAVAIRAVGEARGLHTLPLVEEPYELIVPDHFLELPAIEALLRTLSRPALQRQVEALGGYDVTSMGRPA